MRAVELFAGAGGLALGASLAGFEPLAVLEWDRWACDTLRENQKRGYPLVSGWPIHEGDVRDYDWKALPTDIELVSGGPPCQPFSMGGKHGAYNDRRDMFPASVDIVRRLRPKAFIFENVKGLTRSAFHNYFEYIRLQLEFPESPIRKSEDWHGHYVRLQAEHSSGKQHGKALTYRLQTNLVNAADYGVPQRRERVFIVGFRYDLETTWSMPEQTHSHSALLHDQWVTGDYWERNKVAKKHRPVSPLSATANQTLTRQLSLIEEPLKPWKTVREALSDMPHPEKRVKHSFINHTHQPGAKAYPGHTGSPLDLPAKTLKAGGHGVPGGENMMVNDDGSYRYFTIRESARLQTFPDGYRFHGAWGEVMRQLGNAVPVELARQVMSSVAIQLVETQLRKHGFKTTADVAKAIAQMNRPAAVLKRA
ncbi:DNA cytosine methyltransferase [Polaromonas sp. JS666]|uniref:DNA cytosine methyltransferase n=1 Tax=Polaromonas sp. (strain JS666 / ATCC BAA-500) TaxID=296591 RepID=UPI00088DC781|nr:DNA cytosine methyltransferase [Polaromonas sp. JS666]SDO19538.1 DNA (cytosine-5)-methyltransferase 1 [Polaromonas sp. JS666]